MKKVIAFCGLVCTDCTAFIATQKNNNEMRVKVAKSWSSEKEIFQPEDINCDGCVFTGRRLLRFCSSCWVRQCGLKTSVKNCAYCDEYPCEKLEGLWKDMEAYEAKTTLEEKRKGL